MAKKVKIKRPARRKPRATRENTECRFCRDKVKYIDYKDIDTLSKLLTQRGKIFSRKRKRQLCQVPEKSSGCDQTCSLYGLASL